MDATTIAFLVPALGFGAIFLLVYSLQRAFDRRAARLQRHLGRFTPRYRGVVEVDPGVLRTRQRFSGIAVFDRFLHRQSFAERLAGDLAQAALPLRVGEYLVVRWTSALALAGIANLVTGSPLVAAVVGVIGYALPGMYVGFRKGRRIKLINEQLVDALALIAGGLRAGYSFLQGIEAVVRELPPPVSEEFKLVLDDLSIGGSVEDALVALSRRVPADDVDIMVTAMLIQRSSGGNLAEFLDNISRTVRDRLRVRREVQTLTAQQRMSCYVVGALPFAAIGFLTIGNPDYVQVLFGTPHGQIMVGAAAALEVLGFWLMKRVIDISW